MKKAQLKSLVKTIIREIVNNNEEGGTHHTIIVTTDGFFGDNEILFLKDLLLFDLNYEYKVGYQIEKHKKLADRKHEWEIHLSLPADVNLQVMKQIIEKNPHVVSVKFKGVNENNDFEKILKKAGVDSNLYQQNIPKLPGWKEKEPTIKKKFSRPIHQPKPSATPLGPLEAHSLGYSHNVEMPDPQGGDRDPLNDPLMTGKPLNESHETQAVEELKKAQEELKYWVRQQENNPTELNDDLLNRAAEKMKEKRRNVERIIADKKNREEKWEKEWSEREKSVADMIRNYKPGDELKKASQPNKLKSWLKSLVREVVDVESSGEFKFKDFEWLGNMSGFGVPSDVFKGTAYIGTITMTNDGDHYKIVFVDTPQGKKQVSPESEKNKFKSKNLAAETLFRTWQMIRKEGMFNA